MQKFESLEPASKRLAPWFPSARLTIWLRAHAAIESLKGEMEVQSALAVANQFNN